MKLSALNYRDQPVLLHLFEFSPHLAFAYLGSIDYFINTDLDFLIPVGIATQGVINRQGPATQKGPIKFDDDVRAPVPMPPATISNDEG